MEVDNKLLCGKLENGLKYFVKPCSSQKNSLELKLVVKCGSLFETDDEQGFSHFIEHLGFKGTKSFGHYELVRQLELLGVSYGPEVNASTHLLDTKYRLLMSCDEDFTQLKVGLNILQEWAMFMRISEEDVKEEQKVIHAEYLAKQGLSQRLLEGYWNKVFINSLIAQRMPIGKPEIFLACTHQQLRSYYEEHYNPSNIGVIVVGDISNRSEEVKQLIFEAFESFPPVESPCKVISGDHVINLQKTVEPNHFKFANHAWHHFPVHSKDVVVALVDKQISRTQISFEFFWPSPSSNSKEFLHLDLQWKVLTSILNRRFNKLCRGVDVGNPLAAGSSELGSFSIKNSLSGVSITSKELVRGLKCYGLSLQLADKGSRHVVRAAMAAVLFELDRLNVYGVTQQECDYVKKNWINKYTERLKNPNVVSVSMCAQELEDYFLYDEQICMPSLEEECEVCINYLQHITAAQINIHVSLLDAHLPEAQSKSYYNHAAGSDEQTWQRWLDTRKFRTVIGQFGTEVDCTESELRSQDGVVNDALLQEQLVVCSSDVLQGLLAEARGTVAGLSASLRVWPDVQVLRAQDILRASIATLHTNNNNILIENQISANSCLLAGPDGEDLNNDCDNDNDNTGDPLACTCCCEPGDSWNNYCVQCTSSAKSSARETEVSLKHMESIDSHLVQLSNGMTVCLKYMPQESPGKLSMQAFCLGGTSEQSIADNCAMNVLDDLCCSSGLNALHSEMSVSICHFTGTLLQDLLIPLNTSVHFQKHGYHRGIGGSCPAEHMEMLLALITLKMSASQAFSDAELNACKQALLNEAQAEVNSPYATFMTRASLLVHGDVPTFRPLTAEVINSLTVDQIRQLHYQQFVRDRNKFSFVFVGDLPELSITTNLLEKYLGQFEPVEDAIQSFTPYNILTPCSKVAETVWRPADNDKASSMTVMVADMPLHDQTDFVTSLRLNIARRMLQMTLLDRFRMQLGKVYSVSVESSRSSLSNRHVISIGFNCDVADVDVLQALLAVEIQRMTADLLMPSVISDCSDSPAPPLTAPPQDTQALHAPCSDVYATQLTSVKENLLKTHAQSIQLPSYWLFWLLDTIKYHKAHCKTIQGDELSKALPELSEFVDKAVKLRASDRTTIIADTQLHHVGLMLSTYFDINCSVTIDIRPNTNP